MDKTLYVCDHTHADQSARITALEAELAAAKGLLTESTRLLFEKAGKPSRELFAWWRTRNIQAKINAMVT